MKCCGLIDPGYGPQPQKRLFVIEPTRPQPDRASLPLKPAYESIVMHLLISGPKAPKGPAPSTYIHIDISMPAPHRACLVVWVTSKKKKKKTGLVLVDQGPWISKTGQSLGSYLMSMQDD